MPVQTMGLEAEREGKNGRMEEWNALQRPWKKSAEAGAQMLGWGERERREASRML